MAHSASAQLDRLVSASREVFARYPYASTLPVLAAVSLPWLYKNHSLYVAMGQSGLGFRVGWILSLLVKPLERETTSTQQYERDPDKRSWLAEASIPERRGVRPMTGWHCLPHRQISKHPSEEMKTRLKGVFDELAERYSGSVVVEPSRFEGVEFPALVLPREAIKSGITRAARGEIAHIHREVEWSLHVMLSPMDCKFVLDNNWGERHPLSWGIGLPSQYVMIYAPRNDEELDVVGKIMEAAIKYMTACAN